MHVTICIVSRDENARREAFEYVRRACEYARARGIRADFGMSFSAHTVDHARNRAVAGVIDTDCTHVLMVDDDVFVPEDVIPALLSVDADIAGGCYPGMKRVKREFSRLCPCVLIRRGQTWAASWFDGIIDATAVAGGCMMIRKEVFAKVGFPWFRWPQRLEEGEVKHKSDDVDFCERAAEAGCTIKAHGNVRCSHFKEVDLALFIAQPGQPPWEPHWICPPSLARQAAFPDYGSHIPVLRAIGRHLNGGARKIVEYGSGKYSTPVFVDREWYEHAESVTSYESDPEWMETVQRLVNDERHTSYLTPMDRMADNIEPDADVVLIDCDYSHDEDNRFQARCDLIRAYEQHEHPVVVVHDSNFKSIAPTVNGSQYRYRATFKPEFGPCTTVLSNNVPVEEIEVG